MKLLTYKYFNTFKEQLTIDLFSALKEMDEIELTPKTFTFYTSVAVISSSRIEGEQMDIDSYTIS